MAAEKMKKIRTKDNGGRLLNFNITFNSKLDLGFYREFSSDIKAIVCSIKSHLVLYNWRVTDKYGGTCEKSKLYYNKDSKNELVGHDPN